MSLLGVAAVLASCTASKSEDAPTLTGEALLDPNNCLPCHADQFREWSGSMHAYAGEDPVFVAADRSVRTLTSLTKRETRD